MKKPDFLIIGAQKSGTTSLAKNFNSHPKLHCITKEIHFFDHLWDKGPEWYYLNFKEDHELWGEKTPEYLFNEKCHPRMKQVAPDAKLIIILRNPITRAFSAFHDYKNKAKNGYKNKVYGDVRNWDCFNAKASFQKNLDMEINSGFKKGFIKRGFYIKQINSLLEHFPKEQINISILEHVQKNQVEEYCKIYRFLEIDPVKHEKYFKANLGFYAKKIKPMHRKEMAKIFKPYNEQLFDFLGYRIKEWN